MPSKLGLFINLDYAHQSNEGCSLAWQKIIYTMLKNGFSVDKRALVIKTDKTIRELAHEVNQLFEEIRAEQADFYTYIKDCYILNIDNFTDLSLPDTRGSIDVQDVDLEDLDALGVNYELLPENT